MRKFSRVFGTGGTYVDYAQAIMHFCDSQFWILSKILVSCYFVLDYIGVKSVLHV